MTVRRFERMDPVYVDGRFVPPTMPLAPIPPKGMPPLISARPIPPLPAPPRAPLFGPVPWVARPTPIGGGHWLGTVIALGVALAPAAYALWRDTPPELSPWTPADSEHFHEELEFLAQEALRLAQSPDETDRDRARLIRGFVEGIRAFVEPGVLEQATAFAAPAIRNAAAPATSTSAASEFPIDPDDPEHPGRLTVKDAQGTTHITSPTPINFQSRKDLELLLMALFEHRFGQPDGNSPFPTPDNSTLKSPLLVNNVTVPLWTVLWRYRLAIARELLKDESYDENKLMHAVNRIPALSIPNVIRYHLMPAYRSRLFKPQARVSPLPAPQGEAPSPTADPPPSEEGILTRAVRLQIQAARGQGRAMNPTLFIAGLYNGGMDFRRYLCEREKLLPPQREALDAIYHSVTGKSWNQETPAH